MFHKSKEFSCKQTTKADFVVIVNVSSRTWSCVIDQVSWMKNLWTFYADLGIFFVCFFVGNEWLQSEFGDFVLFFIQNEFVVSLLVACMLVASHKHTDVNSSYRWTSTCWFVCLCVCRFAYFLNPFSSTRFLIVAKMSLPKHSTPYWFNPSGTLALSP